MDKKTLALLGITLIVVGIVGLALSSGYSRFTYGGYSPQWGGYGGMGPGGMMGGNMLVSGGIPYNPNGSLVSLDQAGGNCKEISGRSE